MHLLECVFNLEHCICTEVESNPIRVISLLSDSSPRYYFRYRERMGRRLIIEAALEESRAVALVL